MAEFTAAMLGQILGYTPHPQSGHEPYVAHWATLLADEPEALTRAASAAQAAADYLARFADRSTEAADSQVRSWPDAGTDIVASTGLVGSRRCTHPPIGGAQSSTGAPSIRS